MQRITTIAAVAAIACWVGGCGQSESNTAAAPNEPAKAASLTISGKVTTPDGRPLAGDIKDVAVPIYGVSEAAEKVSYSPAVKPDGTYRQKVAAGQYAFNPATVTVLYNNAEFRLPLEPVGNLWNKNRDAADGITQDFVWKPSGPTPYGQSNGLDIGNHTHWYGLSVGVRANGYREDLKASPKPIPDNTKLTFTLTPTGRAIDGTEPKPISIDRTYSSKSYASIDLNDLLPAPYELTGTATLPDGSTKPLLLQGRGDYPGFKPSVKITVEKDGILGGMWKQPVQFAID